LHDIAGLVLPVVRAGGGAHDARLVTDDYDLTSRRDHVWILNATQLSRRQAGTVDDQIRFFGGMVDVSCFGDVLEDGSFDDDFVLETLGHEPGQVERGVDANGGEGGPGIHAGGKLILGDLAELAYRMLVQSS